MIVNFYALQQHTETKIFRELFLFQHEWAQIMTGISIVHGSVTYQIDRLTWINEPKGILKAVCLEVPNTPPV